MAMLQVRAYTHTSLGVMIRLGFGAEGWCGTVHGELHTFSGLYLAHVGALIISILFLGGFLIAFIIEDTQKTPF